jgi:hypothetical protein
LESQPALFDRQVTDLSQVSGIDITPRISFTRSGIGEIRGEVFRILVWFDNISNSKSVDVVFKASGEGSCCFLTADLGECVLEDCQLVKSCDIEKWPYESSGSTS